MTVAVIDTNVLLSGLLGYARPTSPPAWLLRCWEQNEFVMIMSPSIFEELLETLTRPYFVANISVELGERALDVVQRFATWTHPEVEVRGVAPDPDDDHLISAAMSARADCHVTGDRALRELGSYGGVQFVTPREFLDILKGDDI